MASVLADRAAVPPVQRQASDVGVGKPVGEVHDLTAARFAGQPLLEVVFDGHDRVHQGSDPDAVTRIQQALVDVESLTGRHYKLGRTGPAANGVDGVYGPLTSSAVRAFKADESLGSTEFGDVGPRTMARLDELFSKGGGGKPPAVPCTDGEVSLEPDPIPDIPAPTVTFLPAGELLALVRKRQTPGEVVPSKPPLGATIPTIDNVQPVTAKAVPDGDGCFRCVAQWPLPNPALEVFIATGVFSDEKRFWVTQEGDNRDCPTPVPTLKDVKKVILPSAISKVSMAEQEHVADFRRAFRMAIHRWTANVGRLSEPRTHLRAANASECVDKVTAFLNQQSGMPINIPLAVLSQVFRADVVDLFRQTKNRDVEEHLAISNPPMERDPIRPTFDLARNPFGCSAFLRRFDEKCMPLVPGPSAEQVISDIGDPPRQRWHSL